MELTLYQIDAFTDRVFAGNPAALVPLTRWLDNALMQAIALENNLSETAFFVPRAEPGGYDLRWFTPASEVDLCGHATLAAGHLLLTRLAPGLKRVDFETRSGTLSVTRVGEGRLALRLPSHPPTAFAGDEALLDALGAALGARPHALARAVYLLAIYEDARAVRALEPGPSLASVLGQAGFWGLIVTAPGDEPGVDFVSRFFAPAKGVIEDPVTGSAHSTLVPYWSKRLGRARLLARQVSPRGGSLHTENGGDTVVLEGRCADYLVGTITV